MIIRRADDSDFAAIWLIFESIVRQGATYAYAPDTSVHEARQIWMQAPEATFVAEEGDDILGTYILKPNQPGLGGHVCNAAFMVAPEARGRGIAAALCEHSQAEARARGYLAMQFNLVVATNEGAVRLWQKLGFGISGTLPKAFRHKSLGFVDAHVMYKWLGED
ncbi:MAG: GNAT family N-acetyltransferase [Alphaproteobacteria bacterium]|nr:MAG: GNAT family N-acetyltransferase [Alphaproteobacteria bacterium]